MTHKIMSNSLPTMNHAYICGFNGFKQIGQLESFLQGVSTASFQDGSERNDHGQSEDVKTESDPSQIQTFGTNPNGMDSVDSVRTVHTGNCGDNEVFPDKDNERTNSNALFLRKMCSFPESVHFAHVEISWSRLGITMSILKGLDLGDKQLDPDQEKLRTNWHQLTLTSLSQHQQDSSRQEQNHTQIQKRDLNFWQHELHLDKEKHNQNQQQTHLDASKQARYLTTLVCGFSGAEKHIKEPTHLLLDDCELKASNEIGMLLQQRDKLFLLGHGSRQTGMLRVVCGSDETGNVSTIGSVSGMSSKFVASYDVISVAELCVEEKELEKNTEAQIDDGYPRLLLSCLDSGLSIQHVSCGLEHSVFLTCHGTVLTCGSGSRGQLGHGELEEEESPRAVSALEGVRCVCVAAGGWHSTAVTDCGDLYVWGWNECGQLGLPCPSLQSSRLCLKHHHRQESDTDTEQQQRAQSMKTEEAAPASLHLWPHCVDLVDGTTCDQSEEAVVVTEVACGTRHSAVLTAKGHVFTTGWNKYKQLGLPHTNSIDKFSRVQFPDNASISTVTQLWCGAWNSMFVVQDMLPVSAIMPSSQSTSVSS